MSKIYSIFKEVINNAQKKYNAADITAPLVASFTTTGAGVTVGPADQVSGTTPNDFTNPVPYTVTAVDGTSTVYTVTVTKKAVEIFVANSSGSTLAVFSAGKIF